MILSFNSFCKFQLSKLSSPITTIEYPFFNKYWIILFQTDIFALAKDKFLSLFNVIITNFFNLNFSNIFLVSRSVFLFHFNMGWTL